MKNKKAIQIILVIILTFFILLGIFILFKNITTTSSLGTKKIVNFSMLNGISMIYESKLDYLDLTKEKVKDYTMLKEQIKSGLDLKEVSFEEKIKYQNNIVNACNTISLIGYGYNNSKFSSYGNHIFGNKVKENSYLLFINREKTLKNFNNNKYICDFSLYYKDNQYKDHKVKDIQLDFLNANLDNYNRNLLNETTKINNGKRNIEKNKN